MLILAVDNSLDHLNLALAQNDAILSQSSIKGPKTPSEIIWDEASGILKESNRTINDVEALFVTLGPGSFTGVRVCLAFAKGIASAKKIPLIGVSTLDALAFAARAESGEFLCPLIDAKKGEVFTALYKTTTDGLPERISAYQAVKPEDLEKILPQSGSVFCFGTGASLCEPALSSLSATIIAEKDKYNRISMEALVKAGLLSMKEKSPSKIAPIYGRKSEAEIKFNVSIG